MVDSLMGDAEIAPKLEIIKGRVTRFSEFRRILSLLGGDPRSLIPPLELSGNGAVWRIAGYLLSGLLSGELNPASKGIVTGVFIQSEIIAGARSGPNASKLNTFGRFDSGPDSARDLSMNLRAVAEDLMQWRVRAADQASKAQQKIRDSPTWMQLTGKGPVTNQEGVRLAEMKLVLIGSLYLIYTPHEVYSITSVHFDRLVAFFKAVSHQLYIFAAIQMERVGGALILERLIETANVASEEPEAIGEYLKAARTRYVTKLAATRSPIKHMERKLASTWDPMKSEMSLALQTIWRIESLSIKSHVLLLNLYKAIPHPDVDLYRAFEELAGLTQPNRISMQYLERFRGTLRKQVFRSMLDSGLQPYLAALPPKDGFNGAKVAQMTLDTSRRLEDFDRISWKDYAMTRFLECRTLCHPENIELHPADKASGTEEEVDVALFEEAMAWSKEKSYSEFMTRPEAIQRLAGVNDQARALATGDVRSGKEAFQAFRHIVRLHTNFEKRFPGREPEDIPNEELRRFVLETPGAGSIVNTEPKFGELHKQITRIFYMAHPHIKAITQRVERIARQISRKQMGVSITKTFTSRAKDTNDMILSMQCYKGDEEPLYISFDMSKFSQKFPMILVREYGNVLAEITGEDSLKRLDVIFRSSVVIHNSRDHFYALAGILGGFEGFLNFIWTSIHATIMSIAQEGTGLSGTVLTYSDDGLLAIYVKEGITEVEVQRALDIIQDSYRKFGLIFHFGKTIVSYNTWEYLGDVCHERAIVPMFLKESSSVGHSEPSSGLCSLLMEVTAIGGQGRALAMAGFNSIFSYAIAHREAFFRIKSRALRVPDPLIHFLLLVPNSLGGLRIPSPFEMQTSLGLPEVSYFIEELAVMSEHFPKYSAALIEQYNLCEKSTSEIFDKQVLGSYLTSFIPGFSVDGIMQTAYEEAVDKAGGEYKKLEVISDRQLKDLRVLLTGSINVPIHIFAEIASQTEQFRRAQEARMFVTGHSIKRILGSHALRSYQGQITRKEDASLNTWIRAVASVEDDIEPTTAFQLCKGWVKAWWRASCVHMRPQPPRVPPVYMLRIEKSTKKRAGRLDGEAISIYYEPDKGRRMIDQYYVEKVIMRAADATAMSWNLELSPESESGRNRRFLRTLVALSVSEPGLGEMCQAIARIFGLQIPNLVFTSMPHISRVKSNYGIGLDAQLGRMQYYTEAATTSVGGDYRRIFNSDDTADRTTPLITAKWLAAHALSSEVGLLMKPKKNRYEYVFSWSSQDMDYYCHPLGITADPSGFRKIMDSSRFKVSKVPDYMLREIDQAMGEMRAIEDYNATSYLGGMDFGTDAERSRCLYLAMQITSIAGIVTGIMRPKPASATFTTPWISMSTSTPLVAARGLARAALCELGPTKTRQLANGTKPELAKDYSAIINTFREKGIPELIGGYGVAELAEVGEAAYDLELNLHNLVIKSTATFQFPFIVTRDRCRVLSRVTDAESSFYRRMSRGWAADIRSSFVPGNPRFDVYGFTSIVGATCDDLLTDLSIIAMSLRPSPHRDFPANSTTVGIRHLRYALAARYLVQKGLAKFKAIRQQIQPIKGVDFLEALNGDIRGVVDVMNTNSDCGIGHPLGPDHNRVLFEEFSEGDLARIVYCYTTPVSDKNAANYNLFPFYRQLAIQSMQQLGAVYAYRVLSAPNYLVANSKNIPTLMTEDVLVLEIPDTSHTRDHVYGAKLDAAEYSAVEANFLSPLFVEHLRELLIKAPASPLLALDLTTYNPLYAALISGCHQIISKLGGTAMITPDMREGCFSPVALLCPKKVAHSNLYRLQTRTLASLSIVNLSYDPDYPVMLLGWCYTPIGSQMTCQWLTTSRTIPKGIVASETLTRVADLLYTASYPGGLVQLASKLATKSAGSMAVSSLKLQQFQRDYGQALTVVSRVVVNPATSPLLYLAITRAKESTRYPDRVVVHYLVERLLRRGEPTDRNEILAIGADAVRYATDRLAAERRNYSPGRGISDSDREAQTVTGLIYHMLARMSMGETLEDSDEPAYQVIFGDIPFHKMGVVHVPPPQFTNSWSIASFLQEYAGQCEQDLAWDPTRFLLLGEALQLDKHTMKYSYAPMVFEELGDSDTEDKTTMASYRRGSPPAF
jgi:hypothetical protein